MILLNQDGRQRAPQASARVAVFPRTTADQRWLLKVVPWLVLAAVWVVAMPPVQAMPPFEKAPKLLPMPTQEPEAGKEHAVPGVRRPTSASRTEPDRTPVTPTATTPGDQPVSVVKRNAVRQAISSALGVLMAPYGDRVIVMSVGVAYGTFGLWEVDGMLVFTLAGPKAPVVSDVHLTFKGETLGPGLTVAATDVERKAKMPPPDEIPAVNRLPSWLRDAWRKHGERLWHPFRHRVQPNLNLGILSLTERHIVHDAEKNGKSAGLKLPLFGEVRVGRCDERGHERGQGTVKMKVPLLGSGLKFALEFGTSGKHVFEGKGWAWITRTTDWLYRQRDNVKAGVKAWTKAPVAQTKAIWHRASTATAARAQSFGSRLSPPRYGRRLVMQ